MVKIQLFLWKFGENSGPGPGPNSGTPLFTTIVPLTVDVNEIDIKIYNQTHYFYSHRQTPLHKTLSLDYPPAPRRIASAVVPPAVHLRDTAERLRRMGSNPPGGVGTASSTMASERPLQLIEQLSVAQRPMGDQQPSTSSGNRAV